SSFTGRTPLATKRAGSLVRCAIGSPFLAVVIGLHLWLSLGAAAENRVLVYTKNQIGKGLYVHDNIPASIEAIKKLGAENDFAVDASDDPAVFADANLKRYKALVFSNTNNEIFDNDD